MIPLSEKLVQSTRERSRPCFPDRDYAAIAEILAWAAEPESAGFRLRAPQLRALEVYS